MGWTMGSLQSTQIPQTYCKKLLYLFWLCWVSVAVCKLSLVVVSASHRGGFSCGRAWALGHAGFRSCGAGSVVVVYELSRPVACGTYPDWG